MKIEEKSLQPIYRTLERYPKMREEQLKAKSFYLKELTQAQERDHQHTFNDAESLKALVQSTKDIITKQLMHAGLIIKRPTIQCDHERINGFSFKMLDQANFLS